MATTPTLRGPQGQLASSIDEKETLIRETAFPQAPGDSQEVEIPQGSWHSQLQIDNTQCPAHPINSGVPQGSPVSPILFIIYLSGVFEVIERSVTGIQSLSFADDIGLLASGYSVKEVCDKLQKAAKVAIEWGHDNVVQFDAGKTEAVLLTRKRGRELKDQIQRAQVEVDGHCVPFNLEATRWLGVWLDSGLNLKTHYQTCMRKARAAENRVQRLCQSHGLAPGLARQVQVAAVQSVALYGAELWWQGQKDRLAGIQLMINRQARAITGMLKSTPVGPLVREAGLAPAEALLEARQLRYTTRLLSLPENHPAKKILPVHGLWDNTSLDNSPISYRQTHPRALKA
ncbi:hypothetical protein SI65_03426 [Aspergillus cristatus]|uniref:Reverse transcriptase domain-containing protein n=1 Tax=Aspergillus cristatus TaxID=573508 RepID=A0A1E3BHD2_ASPCR|nr:hypothetical protein SI65_03426 [Aspergillus cristatus]